MFCHEIILVLRNIGSHEILQFYDQVESLSAARKFEKRTCQDVVHLRRTGPIQPVTTHGLINDTATTEKIKYVEKTAFLRSYRYA